MNDRSTREDDETEKEHELICTKAFLRCVLRAFLIFRGFRSSPLTVDKFLLVQDRVAILLVCCCIQFVLIDTLPLWEREVGFKRRLLVFI